MPTLSIAISSTAAPPRSNTSSNDDTRNSNAAHTINPDAADTRNSRTHPDTFGNTDSAAPIPSTTTCDNEREHECAHTPPLDASRQVPPVAASQLDKPEEPPLIRPTYTTHFAPDLQIVQDSSSNTNIVNNKKSSSSSINILPAPLHTTTSPPNLRKDQ